MTFIGINSLDDLIRTSALGDDSHAMNFTKSESASGEQTVEEKEEGTGTPMKTQQNQPLKMAKLEVLLRKIEVSSDSGTTVIPVRCPGIGRVEDYGKTNEDEPACVYNSNNCPYFRDSGFDLDTYYKQITCTVDEKLEK